MDAAAQQRFEEFVRARGPALQRTAYLLTGDWGLAEDLLQTALAKSCLSWGRIRHEDPEGYVRAVLANAFASAWRRRWRGEVPVLELPEPRRADAGEGADEWRRADDRLHLAAALARLPRRQRAVIVLRFHEDLTETAVAAVLGISVGTVKSQTSKALATLRADPALAPDALTSRS